MGWTLTMIMNLLFISGSAQKLPAILTATKYEKGVYKDFSEFLLNKPSITNDFQIIPLSGDRKIERGTADFKLIMLDSAVRRRDAKKFWGACDGETIYVNETQYNGPFKLKKIHGLGRYCYFKGSPPQQYTPIPTPGVIDGAVAGVAIALVNNTDVPYILNVNNGKFFPLDKKLLLVILKRDKELLSSYEDAEKKNKGDVLLSYIKEYNSRHADEAFMDVFDPIEVILYRRGKKDINDPFTIQIGDSVQMEINNYDLKRHFSTNDTLSYCLNGQCGKIALTKKRINYIQCLRNKKTDLPELTKVDRKEGEFYVKGIEFDIAKEKK